MDEDILARMNDSQNRERMLDEFNASTLDDVYPVGRAEQGAKLPSEVNFLVDDHDALFKNLAPTVNVL